MLDNRITKTAGKGHVVIRFRYPFGFCKKSR